MNEMFGFVNGLLEGNWALVWPQGTRKGLDCFGLQIRFLGAFEEMVLAMFFLIHFPDF